MRKIEFKTEGQYLYIGAFDVSDDNKIVSFYIDERIDLNIQNAVGSFDKVESIVSLSELKQICIESKIKATIYPSGRIGFSKLDSSEDELKTCYLSIVSTNSSNYLICVAFDETQPALYKAQLVSVFLINKDF
jgi:hypothetical protein